MQTNTEIINKLFQESISNELNKMGKIKFDDYNRTIKVFLDRQYIPLNVISLLRELFLRLHGEDNNYTEKKIKGIGNYDLVISFGYRHILKKSLIKQYKAPIINLHISYLPWNRGSHPNFWSFYDNTETGVTIHLIVDDKIDAGPILYRKRVIFSKKESTFISRGS